MPFNIIRADITKVRADVVVKAENSGGETGSAKFTRGRRNTIHTVCPIWNGGKNGEEDLLYSCYKNSLELAVENKRKSIAFPLISVGTFGCPKEKALAVAQRAISDFLKSSEGELFVTLVLFENGAAKLNVDLAEKIQRYIAENYSEERPEYDNKHTGKPFDFHGSNPHSFAPGINMGKLKERLDNQDISFSQKLMKMIDERGLTDSEVYKAANFSKQVFSKIRSDKNYHPKKSTALAFAVALKLTLAETDELLECAGYTLTRSDKTDIIVSYFIESGNYNIFEINTVLFDYNLPLLGSV